MEKKLKAANTLVVGLNHNNIKRKTTMKPLIKYVSAIAAGALALSLGTVGVAQAQDLTRQKCCFLFPKGLRLHL